MFICPKDIIDFRDRSLWRYICTKPTANNHNYHGLSQMTLTSIFNEKAIILINTTCN